MNKFYAGELCHFGILGQKWGKRRYQNPDGTLTEEGKKRYGTVKNLEKGKTLKQIRTDELRKINNERGELIEQYFNNKENKEKTEFAKIIDVLLKDDEKKVTKNITKEIRKKGEEYANEILKKKYSKETLDDAEFQRVKDIGVTAAAVIISYMTLKTVGNLAATAYYNYKNS